ncbi:MAG: hypothetical protein AVDCRST_MAG76-3076, partial [uncultured Acidimicrobiales bacterium]
CPSTRRARGARAAEAPQAGRSAGTPPRLPTSGRQGDQKWALLTT